jgi:hypothetical protein
MSKSTELKAWPIEEGGVVVRGTIDPDVARPVALARLADEEHIPDSAADDLDDFDTDIVVGLTSFLAGTPRRVGLFRWNPCHESNCYDGGGHMGHIVYVDQPQRGAFPGVYWMR